MAEFGRVLTAMVTPFKPDGALDEARAGELARALVASGTDGLVLSGSTGEASTLSRDEKLRLYDAVRDAVGPSVPLIAGTTNSNTAESIELSQAAARHGADGLLISVPAYNKPSQDGIFHHLGAIANAVDLPCILYNVPSRTVTNMTAATVVRLRQFGNIIGLKEASGDLEQIGTIIEACGPDFRVWSGNDGDTLPMLAIGAYGVISVTSHLIGRQIQATVNSFISGDTARAAALHRRQLALNKAMFIIGNPVPLKFALNEIGFSVGNPRLPLVPPDPATAETIRATLNHVQIDLPVPARS